MKILAIVRDIKTDSVEFARLYKANQHRSRVESDCRRRINNCFPHLMFEDSSKTRMKMRENFPPVALNFSFGETVFVPRGWNVVDICIAREKIQNAQERSSEILLITSFEIGLKIFSFGLRHSRLFATCTHDLELFRSCRL